MSRNHIPVATVRRVWAAAKSRCGYCLAPQKLVLAALEIEHIMPLADGGTDDESNLWLACPLCNAHKSSKRMGVDSTTGTAAPLFNPRTQQWDEHFRWSDDGIRILGLTAVGRATVAALQLDSDPIALEIRALWVSVGWHPPASDAIE